jgi:RHS repeat-associated protein
LNRGEQFDPTVDSYYLRARWYQPRFRRFLTSNAYEGDTPLRQSLHRFGYAHQNPVAGTDPSGFFNTGENAFLNECWKNHVVGVFKVNVGMQRITLGGVRFAAKLAFDTICCLDKAWSVLDLVLLSTSTTLQEMYDYLTSPTHRALMTIDAACRLYCGDLPGALGSRAFGFRPSALPAPSPDSSRDAMGLAGMPNWLMDLLGRGNAAHGRYYDLMEAHGYEINSIPTRGRGRSLGIRVDAWRESGSNLEIRELKPDTPYGRWSGDRQLKC